MGTEGYRRVKVGRWGRGGRGGLRVSRRKMHLHRPFKGQKKTYSLTRSVESLVQCALLLGERNGELYTNSIICIEHLQ